MKDIKFRAWDKEKKEMVTDFGYCPYQINPDGGGFYHKHHCSKSASLGSKPEWIPLQYTGLTDKNGVEIYEGDIVRWTEDYEEYHVSLVEKKTTSFYAGFTFGYEPKVCTDGCFYIAVIPENMEVIGNVHQNPELLEEEK